MNSKRRAIRQIFLNREMVYLKNIHSEKESLGTRKKSIKNPTHQIMSEFYYSYKLIKRRIYHRIQYFW